MEILPKIRGVDIIRFGEEDVVRHDLVTRIVKAYNRRDAKLPTDRQNKKGKSRSEKQDEAEARNDD